MIRSLSFFLILFFCFPARAWIQDAFHLIGESPQTRARAISNLRKEKNLEKKLRAALKGPQRGYALDVISALHMDSLLPSLLKEAREDQSGLTYLTVNELISAQNKATILDLYEERLFSFSNGSTSGPAQVILLDTLARANVPLEVGSLHRLMESSDWPEVRMSVLNYARHFLLDLKNNDYLPLLRDGLEDASYQVREQSLYLISEMNWKQQVFALRALGECDTGFTPSARKLCEELKNKI